MNLLELFSGTCAFHEGLKNAGFKFNQVYYSEVNAHCIANTRYNHPEFVFLGDVKRITKANFPENEKINIITFGSPCQGFSLAGKRKGLEHDGSGLIAHAFRLIDELRPDIFIWENVKGVMTKNNRHDFWAIIQAYIDLEEYTLEWQLCDTNWVLPQNRSRMFLVGHRKGTDFGKVFPFLGEVGDPYEKSQELNLTGKTMKNAPIEEIQNHFESACDKMPTLGQVNHKGDCDIYAGFSPTFHRKIRLSDIVQKEYLHKYLLNEGQMNYLMKDDATRLKKGFARILSSDEQNAITLVASSADNWTDNFILDNSNRHLDSVISIDLKQLKSKTAQGMVKSDVVGTLYDDCRQAVLLVGEIRTQKVDGESRWAIDISPTLKHGYRDCGSNMLVLGTQLEKDYFFIRRLTEIECERLQGLEDNHTQMGIYKGEIKPIIQSKRYEMLGNGITATMAMMIGRRLLKK